MERRSSGEMGTLFWAHTVRTTIPTLKLNFEFRISNEESRIGGRGGSLSSFGILHSKFEIHDRRLTHFALSYPRPWVPYPSSVPIVATHWATILQKVGREEMERCFFDASNFSG
jgi:hypothetical protein